MVIFHSYVNLPEGIKSARLTLKLPGQNIIHMIFFGGRILHSFIYHLENIHVEAVFKIHHSIESWLVLFGIPLLDNN